MTALSRTEMEMSLIKASGREKYLCQDPKVQAELSVTAHPYALAGCSYELSSFQ